jgi:hypothetical protein
MTATETTCQTRENFVQQRIAQGATIRDEAGTIIMHNVQSSNGHTNVVAAQGKSSHKSRPSTYLRQQHPARTQLQRQHVSVVIRRDGASLAVVAVLLVRRRRGTAAAMVSHGAVRVCAVSAVVPEQALAPPGYFVQVEQRLELACV